MFQKNLKISSRFQNVEDDYFLYDLENQNMNSLINNENIIPNDVFKFDSLSPLFKNNNFDNYFDKELVLNYLPKKDSFDSLTTSNSNSEKSIMTINIRSDENYYSDDNLENISIISNSTITTINSNSDIFNKKIFTFSECYHIIKNIYQKCKNILDIRLEFFKKFKKKYNTDVNISLFTGILLDKHFFNDSGIYLINKENLKENDFVELPLYYIKGKVTKSFIFTYSYEII